MTEWITCREFIDFLWAYLSGEVTPQEREEFEYHLSGCPSCVAYMNTYRKAMELEERALGEEGEEVPADVPEELVQAILAAKKKTET